MKKFIFILIVCALCIAQNGVAQFKVANNGNAGIGLGDKTPLSPLSIDTVGNSNSKLCIAGYYTGLSVCRGRYDSYGKWTAAIDVQSEVNVGNFNESVLATTITPTLQTYGRAWGVLGQAGNATTGYNYGVMGILWGQGYGAGVMGTINGSTGGYVPGTYAGYFVGNVAVTGTINGIVLGVSDERYKKNVTQLSNDGVLDKVLQMNPIEYNFTQRVLNDNSKNKNNATGTTLQSDTVDTPQNMFDEKSQMFQKKQYGLIAQDLQKLYPDLVYSDDEGYLSINYIGIIPLLIESVKELKTEVETLKDNDLAAVISLASENVIQTPNDSKGNSIGAYNAKSSGIDMVTNENVLYQNAPNPFSHSTEIKYYLASNVSTAYLCIYDLQGKELKQISLSGHGACSETIHAHEFHAGMYLYSLIVNGNMVDTKRMTLTKY